MNLRGRRINRSATTKRLGAFGRQRYRTRSGTRSSGIGICTGTGTGLQRSRSPRNRPRSRNGSLGRPKTPQGTPRPDDGKDYWLRGRQRGPSNNNNNNNNNNNTGTARSKITNTNTNNNNSNNGTPRSKITSTKRRRTSVEILCAKTASLSTSVSASASASTTPKKPSLRSVETTPKPSPLSWYYRQGEGGDALARSPTIKTRGWAKMRRRMIPHCRICKAETEEHLIKCAQCNAQFHLECLAYDRSHADAICENRRDDWLCPKCVVCARCSEDIYDSENVQCALCDRAYHGRCRKPPPPPAPGAPIGIPTPTPTPTPFVCERCCNNSNNNNKKKTRQSSIKSEMDTTDPDPDPDPDPSDARSTSCSTSSTSVSTCSSIAEWAWNLPPGTGTGPVATGTGTGTGTGSGAGTGSGTSTTRQRYQLQSALEAKQVLQQERDQLNDQLKDLTVGATASRLRPAGKSSGKKAPGRARDRTPEPSPEPGPSTSASASVAVKSKRSSRRGGMARRKTMMKMLRSPPPSSSSSMKLAPNSPQMIKRSLSSSSGSSGGGGSDTSEVAEGYENPERNSHLIRQFATSYDYDCYMEAKEQLHQEISARLQRERRRAEEQAQERARARALARERERAQVRAGVRAGDPAGDRAGDQTPARAGARTPARARARSGARTGARGRGRKPSAKPEDDGLADEELINQRSVIGDGQAKWIHYGGWVMRSLNRSPYPKVFRKCKHLFICHFCLTPNRASDRHRIHLELCGWCHPPGNEIYRDGPLSLWEVDGIYEAKYCTRLCLFSILFLPSKVAYRDTETFMFYLLTEKTDDGHMVVGYFSKEKRPSQNNNLSCLLVFPMVQRSGYGKMLIDLSYKLSLRERKIGGPEHPLSNLGLLTYRSYWRAIIVSYIRKNRRKTTISIKDISTVTGIHMEDIVSTLTLNKLIRCSNNNYFIDVKKVVRLPLRSMRFRAIKDDCLVWCPSFDLDDGHPNKMGTYMD